MTSAIMLITGLFTGIVIGALLWAASPAKAAETVLPIRGTVVQCGPKEGLKEACEKDARCCRLIERVRVTAPQSGG